MKRNSHKKNLSISIILLLILVIGIGYAYLTSNLSISGTTGIVGNSWDIHFENLNVKDGSVTAINPATISNSTTDITYSIRLEKPKDYYEFTVDVKNDGTLPGKVSISTLNGITSEAAPVIDYTITYINGTSVNIGDILNASSKKTIRVRVFYKDDISATDLPGSNLNLSLTYTLQYVQSDEEEINAGNLLQNLATTNTCITKYTGEVTDQPGQTVTASNVYFDKCADKRNIIFGGFCWQAIRTTETGGIKMIYNGEPVDGKCESTRGDHTGILGINSTIQALDSEYLYGSSFIYDRINNVFTLTSTFLATWSDSTYENLIGKFTCKSSSDTCTTLYYVGVYKSNKNAYTSGYTIGSTNYAQIGSSTFNANGYSLSMSGYMFNKTYDTSYTSGSVISDNIKFSSSFTYNEEINMYSLSGGTTYVNNWSNSYNSINNKRYTCLNTTGNCNRIYFIYRTTSSYLYYVSMSDGKGLSEFLTDMLSSNDVNKYNSSIKGIIDAWYAQNLSNKTRMLEDTVYCNDRNIRLYGGWSESGSTTSNTYLSFNNDELTTLLLCQNETDQFAVGNNKAKLTYPVGMINHKELYNIGNNSTTSNNLRITGAAYWGISPKMFNDYYVLMNTVDGNGNLAGYSGTQIINGVRLAITLASDSVISRGVGSVTEPWIVQE